jgi:hypothetical protein
MDFFQKPLELPRSSFCWADVAAETPPKGVEVKPAQGRSLEQDEETRWAVEAALRGQEAAREAGRILALQREDFQSKVEWAFAVLDAPATSAARDPAAVQRSFRSLMKKLHPDKVGHSSDLMCAVEMLREAKDLSLKHVLEVERPGPPRTFQAAVLCAVPGRRRIRLQWLPPEDKTSCPVRRYVVRVVDPVCGRALTVAVLEPEYNEELRRFVSIKELGSYILAEQELQKMPGLWKQSTVTVQVAAANEAGESPWAVLKLPLTTAPEKLSAVPTVGLRQTSPNPSECYPRSFAYGQPTVAYSAR